jgi:PhnB protein
MAGSVKAIPDGYGQVIPNLVCNNASAAIEFYKNVFGAKERVRMPGPGGKVMHAEIEINNTVIFVNDPMGQPAPAESKTHAMQLCLYVQDADAIFNKAIKAGAHSSMPLDNMFWGDRYGKFVDPYGHEWGVLTHVEDVSMEEMQRRQKEFMAKAAGQH